MRVCTPLAVSHTFMKLHITCNFVDRPDVMSIEEFSISRHLCEPDADDNVTSS